ncbi:MAG TPA: HD-GYP domain-containing protein [Gemmatimonadales bacterium]|nr:HD-GYP domain-containing protein [Gemmatimonadales bacterium]
MSDKTSRSRENAQTYVLVAIVAAASLYLLLARVWELPAPFPSRFWNALATFAILGIVSDSLSFKIPVARVTTSVGFVPFIASVALFNHPWPMAVAGVTALVVDAFVRHKPAVRVAFNTAQYMLATGLASLVYSRLGGSVSLDTFDLTLIPFAGLVVTFFVVNKGSVSLAVSFSNGLSVREAWGRIGKDAIGTDLFSSTLAALLVFLYVKLQLLGIAVLVFPWFLLRQLYQMNLLLQEELEEKLELMVKSMEARDPYTSGHSRRVSEYALAIARDLKFSADELDGIKRAALLHDVGKIYEEFAPLLRKEGKLSAEEMMTMRTHVVRSAQLVATAGRLRGAVEGMIRHHHENFDGTGYPDGLTGEEIPIGARIIMIADTIDAMTTDRPYRKAMPLARAVEELEKYAGRQFDPGLVKVAAKSAGIRRLLGLDQRIHADAPEPSRAARPAWAQRIAH